MNICKHAKRIFKSYMIAGTVVLVPLIGTYLILKFIIVSVDDMVISMIPDRFQQNSFFLFDIPGLGLVITLALIFIVGFITRLYIGNKLLALGDRILSKIPVGRSIYSGLKKFMGSIFTDREKRFKSVVLVEYPRKNCWVLGFMTSDCIPAIQKAQGEKLVNIFVPTTPNPTSGFLIMVAEQEIHRLNMGIDEAFKLLISGGLVQEDILTQETGDSTPEHT